MQHADLGHFCLLFNTNNEAISKGCPGELKKQIAKYDPAVEKKTAEQQEIIDRCNSLISKLEEQLQQRLETIRLSENEYREAFTKAERVRQPLRDKVNQMALLELTAKRYQRMCDEINRMTSNLRDLPKKIKDSLEQRKKATQRYNGNRNMLDECFKEALFRTTGLRYDATIEINANGIFPKLQVGRQSSGEAMGTSTVLAFDLACMLASMKGMGNHPRFLIDDSPRDADMEPHLYQSFLQSIADLEKLTPNAEAAFQYILTTTTRPEGVLAEEPYLRLTLDRIKPENMLFGVRF